MAVPQWGPHGQFPWGLFAFPLCDGDVSLLCQCGSLYLPRRQGGCAHQGWPEGVYGVPWIEVLGLHAGRIGHMPRGSNSMGSGVVWVGEFPAGPSIGPRSGHRDWAVGGSGLVQRRGSCPCYYQRPHVPPHLVGWQIAT